MSYNFKRYDRVRWSDAWLKSLGIEPRENRPTGFITRVYTESVEVCYESPDGVCYILCHPTQVEYFGA